MELYKGTTVTETPEVRIAKPIASLIIGASAWAFDTAVISIWVERANGSNTEIANQIPLIDIAYISTYGNAAIFPTNWTTATAKIELTPSGAVHLEENEAIKFKITGLYSAVTYQVNGLEEAVNSRIVNRFDRKVALAGEATRIFDVDHVESMCLKGINSIKEINITYDNGQVCKYNAFELVTISIDTDPIQRLAPNSGKADVYVFDTNYLVFPLLAVRQIEIVKVEADVVNLTFKSEKHV